MSDDLYDGPCVAGCQHYHGGEVRHHKDCGHYPDSLTKVFEGRIRELEAQVAQSVKVKPLEWKSFGTMAFVADAPLFGRLRVERFGRDGSWTICFSVPGFCDTFLDGEWPDAESAKVAAQADYERRILSVLEPAPITPAEARENVVDTIEEIICETHDIYVRDRDYALMVAYQEGFSDGKAKAEECAALSALAGQGG